jgi:cytochrome P450
MRNVALRPEERVPLEEIDLFDPQRYRLDSQQLAWHTLRATAPVWPSSHGDRTFWSVTRYRDVLGVIKDHRSFSSAHGTILAVLSGDSAGGKTINLMDPPRHVGVRVPTMRLLSTQAIYRAHDRVRQRIETIFAPCRDGDEVDLVPMMMRLPMAVVGDVIGVPEEYWDDVAVWTMSGVAPADMAYAQGAVADTLRAAHFELFAMFGDLIRERRARPRHDVISALLEAQVEGRKLTPDEVLLNCYSFVMGANTTTPHVGSQLMLALMERPGQWEMLRRGAASIASAVEEGLRWATPTNHLVRYTVRPAEVAGIKLGPGELVCAWIGSANRDETTFSEPYAFDVTRAPNPHLAFGKGIHYCNGAPGARLVLRLALQHLLSVLESVQLAGEPTHLASNFINGISRLPAVPRPASVRQPCSAVVKSAP